MLGLDSFALPELAQVPIPPLHAVDVTFDPTRICDVRPHILGQARNVPDLSGKRVALAVGSRGISELPAIVSATIELVRRRGGEPVIIPSMGSHGGGTAAGQLGVLAALGVTAEAMGVPIIPDMETQEAGRTPGGRPVVIARSAATCDTVVLIGRIKPHTGFKGVIESGLLKMAMIGLGKVPGAVTAHKTSLADFPDMLLDYYAGFASAVKVAFGVGIVENAFDQPMRIEVIAPPDIVSREQELLALAKRHMARLPLRCLDVLIIQEMGKEISGPGIDPNVTGKSNSRFFDPALVGAPAIEKMVTLSLTRASKGNASGLGINDVISRRLLEATDLAATYRNVVTAGVYNAARIPIVMPDDRDAIRLALMPFEPGRCRVAWIRNTLSLKRIAVSRSCLDQLPSWAVAKAAPITLEFRNGVLDEAPITA